MNKLFNKKSALVCAGVAGALVLGASMAYFTDYAATSAEGTAGTVAIALDSEINLLNEEGMDILNPGDMRDGAFSVTNMGNKSIDVRETIALTALDREGNAMAFTGDAETQSEFDLYKASDVSEVPGEGYKPNADAKPLEVKSINGNVITYVLPEYSLNGNSDEHAEVETIDGVDAFAKENDFVLVFKGEAGNDWQASTVKIDVIVEAKQHENTGAGWDIVAQEEVSQGSITKDVVMAEEVITKLDAANGGSGAEEAQTLEKKLIFLDKDGNPISDAEFEFGGDGYDLMGSADENGEAIVQFKEYGTLSSCHVMYDGDYIYSGSLTITEETPYEITLPDALENVTFF